MLANAGKKQIIFVALGDSLAEGVVDKGYEESA